MTFDVKLWDVTSAATVDQAAIEAAWRANAVNIFGPHDITVGTFEFVDGDAAARATHSEINLPTGGNDAEQRDACKAFNAITGDERVLHFVLIDKFIDPGQGETLGNSGGIPGAPLDSQFDASCVVVTGVTGDSPANPAGLLTQGVTAWHEAGHFLGLAHTSESDGMTWDFLTDTPECTIAGGTSAQCPDGSNFMFNDTDEEGMSAQQAFMVKRHPFMKATTPPITSMCDGKLVTIDMNLNGGLGTGTAGDDVILGTPGADTILGLAGDDTICAGGDADTVRGGPGADKILGEAGNDSIFGGGGDDVIDGGNGDDVIRGQGGSDTIAGGAGNDTIDGLGAADTIDGGGGDDTISGQNGADVINGGAGADTIKGQTGPDTLNGDGGDDMLFGGNGDDTLSGGPGTDKCAGNLGPNDMAETATCESTPGVESMF